MENNFIQMAASADHAVAYITIAVDCNSLSLLIFEQKWPNYVFGPKSVPKYDSFWVRADFLCPKCDNFACLHTRQDQNELNSTFCNITMIFKVMSQYFPALFKHIHNHIRWAEG